jgi:hypothetical protein
MTKAVTLKADMRIQATPELRLRERRGERLVLVESVPMTLFVGAHEAQCQRNHQQTLERIRERGGFSAGEVVCVLSCLHWSDLEGMSEAHAHHVLYEMIAGHNRGMRVAERLSTEPRLRDALQKIAENDADGLHSYTPQAMQLIARNALSGEEGGRP